MKGLKSILVRGPLLSRSGYGEQARFALRALRTRADVFDIYVDIVGWGQTGWTHEDTEERRWIDQLAQKTAVLIQNKQAAFDISLQVTIPNEWQKLAKYNIGYTAGIESTKISPAWLEKSELMDRIIVVSEHAKHGFDTTVLDAIEEKTGKVVGTHKVTTPIVSVGYPHRDIDIQDIELELETDFNFLTVAQISPRKNIFNTVKWFVEAFEKEEVGLILKASQANNGTIDRYKTFNIIQKVVKDFPERKCKVYLLHGDLTEEEMAGLYTHPKVKALLTLAHGEGFGLPVFEAAGQALPIIAPDWGGYCDFLYMETKTKKGKMKRKPFFATVDYKVAPVQKEAVWPGVLEKESQWCFPTEGKAKSKMLEVYKSYSRFKSWAKKLQKHIKENYNDEKMYNEFVVATGVVKNLQSSDYVFVSDLFAEQYVGGAELSFKTLIDMCPGTYTTLNSHEVNGTALEFYKDKTWVFANTANVSKEVLEKISSSELNYFVSESDFKYCEHRLPQLCEVFSGGSECECGISDKGKLYERFYNNSKLTFFRSESQRTIHLESLKLKKKNTAILSALFSEEVFEYISVLREKYDGLDGSTKDDGWVVSSSPSWVKGSIDSEKWCKENDREYTKVHGKSYGETLELLAQSKGLCFLPKGYDTCPRLVIEAKLLGCELVINDNVLHASEDWFKTDNLNEIEDHLREQPRRFWDLVQDAA
tara:strand:- start:4441 stop:6555 length:2115 start_codon:yes stop_codon:yes gene_type:complete